MSKNKSSAFFQTVKKGLPVIIMVIAILICWEAAVKLFDLPPWLLPAPSKVLIELYAERAVLIRHSLRTLSEALLGMSISIMSGLALGAAIFYAPLLRKTLYPLLVASQTVPMVVLAPLLVIWFGYGLLPKILIVTLACFFPIAINTVTGLQSVDPDLIRLFQSFGAKPMAIFRIAQWPAAIPAILSGTKVAASYAVMAAVVGEWMGSDSGLGVYIIRSAHSFLTVRVFAGILLVSVYSIILFGAVGLIEKKATFWQYDILQNGGVSNE
ncbi:MAG: ABC transporter permease [Bacillota bacterium]|jgi:putative hydroxymethylpyrimidine transport system permease protein